MAQDNRVGTEERVFGGCVINPQGVLKFNKKAAPKKHGMINNLREQILKKESDKNELTKLFKTTQAAGVIMKKTPGGILAPADAIPVDVKPNSDDPNNCLNKGTAG